MKKVLALILTAVLMMSLFAGCGSKTEVKEETSKETTKTDSKDAEKTEEVEKIKIHFASNSFADKWQTYLNDAAKAEAEKLGVELEFSDGKEDAATQLNNVETAIASGAKAIIIVMVDPGAPQPFINACKDAGIPIIAANRKFEGANCFIGSDDLVAGGIQADFIGEALGGKGNVAILEGVIGQNSQVKRTEGLKEELAAKYPDIKVVFEETAKWDRAKGMEVTENWLTTGEEINAIAGNNDEMAIGAINALKAAGKLDSVVVAGTDATIDALEYVKNGELEVTCFQSPFGQGQTAVQTAIKLINGEEVPEYIDVPFEKVSIDNVDDYIKIWQ